MSAPAPAAEHPGDLEFRRYVRGGLNGGHAAVVLAHCLACERCLARLREMLPTADSRRDRLLELPGTAS